MEIMRMLFVSLTFASLSFGQNAKNVHLNQNFLNLGPSRYGQKATNVRMNPEFFNSYFSRNGQKATNVRSNPDFLNSGSLRYGQKATNVRLSPNFWRLVSLLFGQNATNVGLKPNCSAPCPAVKCLSPITTAGTCCPKCPVKQCLHRGKKYENGTSFKDICNTCTCTNGSVSCTEMTCLPKPGQCPRLDPDLPGFCTIGCNNDWSCYGAQKCCYNGCGLTCMLPRGRYSSKRHCPGVFCPELICDNLYTPLGECCEVCPPSITLG